MKEQRKNKGGWTKKYHANAQNAVMYLKNDLRLNWATAKAAKYACENWHYAKAVPAGKLVKIGVWENGSFRGVVIFSRGGSPHLLKRYGLQQVEGCELTRVALRKHKTPVSKIIAIALRMLKKQSPGMLLVVSFAAPTKGHHGGIYQAGNWLYSGTTVECYEYEYKGRTMTHRTVSTWFKKGKFDKKKFLEVVTRVSTKRHRYLMPLSTKMAEQIEKYRQPYPKREKQAMGVIQTPQRRGSTDLHAP